MNQAKTKNQVITYTVERNHIDRIYLCVQEGEVIVNAPFDVTKVQIQEMVEEKRQWIMEQLTKRTSKVKKENKMIEKSPVEILGKDYKLRIQYKNVKIAELDIEEKIIKITLPNKYKKMENDRILDLAIDKMYDSIAKDELERIMEKTRLLVGFAPEDYTIEKLEGMLAKCTKENTIQIDPSIVKYERKIIEYIILHQFCHLKYKKHGKGFHELIKQYMSKDLNKEKVKDLKF